MTHGSSLERRPRTKTRRLGFGRRWRIPVIFLALAAVLTWLAPGFVALQPVRQMILRRALGEFPGKVAVQTLSLGWISPVVADGVEVRDADGQPLLEIRQLRSQRSLWGLLLQRDDVGLFTLDSPCLHAQVWEGSSNVEEAAQWFLERRGQRPAGVAFQLSVERGELQITDLGSQRTWSVSEVEGVCSWRPAAARPLELQLECRPSLGEDARGRLALRTVLRQPGASEPEGELTWQCESLPLDLAEVAARRWGQQVRLAGRFDGDLTARWNDGGNESQLEIRQAVVKDALFAAERWLGSDVWQAAHLTMRGAVARKGAWLRADQLKIESDLGAVELDGEAALAAMSAGRWAAAAAIARSGDYRLRGRVDLARLTRLLPHTLRIREDTAIDTGELSLTLNSETGPSGRCWTGRLELTNLLARHKGQAIVWEDPIQIAFSACDSPSGLTVEHLNGKTSFFALTARGTAAAGQLAADIDLDKFLADVDQFLDLGRLKLAGRLQAQLQWSGSPEEKLTAAGELTVENFAVRALGWRLWGEQKLEASLHAEGRADAGRWARLERADLRLQSGSDYVRAQLLQGVDSPSLAASWPLRCELGGQLASWTLRLQPLVSFGQWSAAGGVQLNADATLSPDRIVLSSAECQINSLQLRGKGVAVDEPRVVAQGNAIWDRRQRRLQADVISLSSSSLALRADQVAAVTAPNELSASGDLAFRADLDRLRSWLNLTEPTPATRLAGMASGNLKFAHQAGVTTAEGSATLQQLVYSARRDGGAASATRPVSGASSLEVGWRPLWQEERVSLAGRGSFQHRDRTVVVDQLRLDPASDLVRLEMQGKITDLAQRGRVDLQGRVAYDWSRIGPWLKPYLGTDFQIRGSDSRPFALRGPVTDEPAGGAAAGATPRQLAGEAGLSWESASLYGIDLGPGELHPRLANGLVTFEPIDLELSQGRLHAEPRIDLTTADPVLTLQQGTLLEGVRITPSMCQGWLKYVAPLLADATRADGTFSLAMEHARTSLRAPEQSEARGVLTIQGAQIGPGPVSQQFLMLAEQVRALVEKRPFRADSSLLAGQWVTLPAQSVAVELVNGRVYHRHLEFLAGDVRIRTQGWVAFDQSLSMTAEVPIQEQWLRSDRVLAALLQGQVVQVPIEGRLSQPKFDNRLLDRLAGQVLNGAASRLLQDNAAGALQNELNRGLQRWFGRP